MDSKERDFLTNRSALAYYSGYGGIEIKKIDESDERIYFTANSYGKGHLVKKLHSSKIKYTLDGRAYFTYIGKRIHLDECLRTNI